MNQIGNPLDQTRRFPPPTDFPTKIVNPERRLTIIGPSFPYRNCFPEQLTSELREVIPRESTEQQTFLPGSELFPERTIADLKFSHFTRRFPMLLRVRRRVHHAHPHRTIWAAHGSPHPVSRVHNWRSTATAG